MNFLSLDVSSKFENVVCNILHGILNHNSFLASGDFYQLLITFSNIYSLDSDLIWIQTVGHFDNVPEIFFSKELILKKSAKTTEA